MGPIRGQEMAGHLTHDPMTDWVIFDVTFGTGTKMRVARLGITTSGGVAENTTLMWCGGRVTVTILTRVVTSDW